MAQQSQTQYEFRYERVELLKTESLGIGSYGAVCKAMCDDLPCAAKILHPVLFQFTVPGTRSVMQNFEQECHLLSAIKHPHIVQYLGTYHDPESKLLVLLMELMDESLTRFLERLQEPLPYHTEVNLSHDIALALSYLHSNGIVHRDLSSNNVLLIAGSRAKVTDFGMVKLYDVNHSTSNHTPLTLCPGTMVYMPPEALRDRPVYSDKLDSFSLGVLVVQMIVRQFPDPGDRFHAIEISDPRIPSGRVQVEVPEIERRQSHIDLIDPAHSLLPVALDCLKDRDTERPSCHELCGRMSTLKASPKYTESVEQSQPTQSANRESREREIQQSHQIQHLQQQLHTKDSQLHMLSDQLQENEHELQQQQEQIVRLWTILTTKDEQLDSNDQRLQQKEAAIAAGQQEIQQFREQLKASEQVITNLHQNLLERDKIILKQQSQLLELLQQQPRQRRGQRRNEEEASGAATTRGSIKLRWRDGGKAPREMYGEVAVVDGSMAYFVLETEVYSYDSCTKEWSELPECPNHGFGLAIVNSLLTAIGGEMPNCELTNSLLSLTNNNWTEEFPPMPTKRWLTAVVSSGKSLVVAGGSGRSGRRDKDLSTVEVMDTEILQWSTASSLPHPLCHATTTLCGDQVYMLGIKAFVTCSLDALLQSCHPQSLGLRARLKNFTLVSTPKVWCELLDTSYYRSTCASVCGQLLAVGGRDSERIPTAAIHMYNTTTNSWEVISHMATPRYGCLVAVLPHNELMVVGGQTPEGKTDSVEFATIV